MKLAMRYLLHSAWCAHTFSRHVLAARAPAPWVVGRWVSRELQAEAAWAVVLPAGRSRKQVSDALERALLVERSTEIETAIVPLLHADHQDDLRQIFRTLQHLPNGINHLTHVLESHIRTIANEALAAVRSSSAASPSSSSPSPSNLASSTAAAATSLPASLCAPPYIEAYVAAALSIYAKFDHMVGSRP